jgi:hypothetical protein
MEGGLPPNCCENNTKGNRYKDPEMMRILLSMRFIEAINLRGKRIHA